MADYSLSDIKALVDDDRGAMGSYGWIILVFLILFAFNGNGLFGNNNNATGGLTQIERDVLTTSCATQKEVLQNRYDAALQMAQLGYQNRECCCDIITASNANTQKILDKMCDENVAKLRNELNLSLQTNLNQKLLNDVVAAIRPCPVPAYLTCSPYSAYNYPWGCCNGVQGV